MEKALIYTRVSTDDQTGEEKHSLKTQQHLCERAILDSGKYHLAENGLYSDPGRSGTNMNRPGLKDMLIRSEDHHISALFIQDTDRLARNAKDHFAIRAILKKNGVKMISVSQPGIDDSAEGDVMDGILAIMNQFQSAITKRKTDKSLEEKFWSGGWPTHAPPGYLNVGDSNDSKIRVIAQDPVRLPLIVEMFKHYATGDYSVTEVSDIAYKKGLVTGTGKQYALSKVFNLLSNHFMHGEMRWKTLVNKGNHIPAISKELFEQCQRVMQFNNKYACRRRKHDFLLRGFMFCETCGCRLTAGIVKKKNKSYYHCTKRTETQCDEKYVEVTSLEKQVQKHFDEIKFSPVLVEKIVARVQNLYQKQRDSIASEKKALNTIKSNLEVKRAVAEEKLINQVISDSAFARIDNKLTVQLENIADEEYLIDRKRNLKINVIREVLKLTNDIGGTYKSASPMLKRLYLGLFWTDFKVSNKKIVNAQKAPILVALEAMGSVSFGESIKSPFQTFDIDSKVPPVQIASSLGGYRELNPN
jgi:site-specific DNA recombinase